MAGYLGQKPTPSPLTTADLGDNLVTNAKMADDAVGLAELSATGTASSSNFLRGDNAWQAAGGAWNVIGTVVLTGVVTATITGLDSTYDTYAIAMSDLRMTSSEDDIRVRFGDSGGIKTDANYDYHRSSALAGTAGYGSIGGVASATGSAYFSMYPPPNDAGAGFGCLLYLHRPGDASMFPFYSGTYVAETSSNVITGGQHFGSYTATLVLDRIQVYSQSGTFSSGRVTVYGIAHA